MRLESKSLSFWVLLVICGMLLLSVPSEAAQRGKVSGRQQVQRVEAQRHQDLHRPDVINSVWNTIKFRFGSWFGITTPSLPTTPQSGNNNPVKDSTDRSFWEHMYDVLYDNGGTEIV